MSSHGDDSGPNLDNVGLAFGLVIAAAASSTLGGAVVFLDGCVRLATKRLLAASLSFAGGVMVYVAAIEIFHKSREQYEKTKSEADAYLLATLTFFLGAAVMMALLKAAHSLGEKGATPTDGCGASPPTTACGASPPNVLGVPGPDGVFQPAVGTATPAGSKRPPINSDIQDLAEGDALKRLGWYAALAISIHNFPEGLAAMIATIEDPSVGVPVAIAIGIHNIPEGFCVALPIYYSTGSKKLALFWATICGLSEIFGALLGYAVLKGGGQEVSPSFYALSFGITGGLMFTMVLAEFIPTAVRYAPDDNTVAYSFLAGMAFISLSLCIEKY